MQSRPWRTSFAEGAYGILLAVYLLCGRWGLTRLSTADSSAWQFLYEVRFVVVLLLAVAVLVKWHRRTAYPQTQKVPQSRHVGAVCLVRVSSPLIDLVTGARFRGRRRLTTSDSLRS